MGLNLMNRFRRQGWIYSLFALLTIFALFRVYFYLTDDFRLSNIQYQIDPEPSWLTPRLNLEQQTQLSHLLSQKFYYIGKGAQCYAFASEDQCYVLKFFKFKHLRPNIFVRLLPSIPSFKQYKEAVSEKKKHKLQGVFEGYALAYRENQKESELFYVHLVPTDYLKQFVTVVDKIGIERRINLDEVVFLVQRKGETFRTYLSRQLKEHRLSEAKESIAQILAMYHREYQKGLYDRDHGVMHNTGFVDNRPFHLDVGKFSKDHRMRQVEFYKKDLEHVVWKIDTWVKNNYPHHYATLSAYLAEQYFVYTGELFDASLIDPQRFKKKR